MSTVSKADERDRCLCEDVHELGDDTLCSQHAQAATTVDHSDLRADTLDNGPARRLDGATTDRIGILRYPKNAVRRMALYFRANERIGHECCDSPIDTASL
jgi:hypothetical protein